MNMFLSKIWKSVVVLVLAAFCISCQEQAPEPIVFSEKEEISLFLNSEGYNSYYDADGDLLVVGGSFSKMEKLAHTINQFFAQEGKVGRRYDEETFVNYFQSAQAQSELGREHLGCEQIETYHPSPGELCADYVCTQFIDGEVFMTLSTTCV